MKKKITPIFVIVLSSIIYSCGNEHSIKEVTVPVPSNKPSPTLFTEMPSAQTGITFNNTLVENDSVNLIANEYTYIGSGIGIGDFNNDGLPDIFFGANQSSCKLYINKSDFKFEDNTVEAGLSTDFWATGISIIDINNDGYDDIYVCVSGSKNPEQRKNKLYINNKDLTFTEKAEEYGLADAGFSTQAIFFDYDNDGDLDMYLLNHLLYTSGSIAIVKRDTSGKSPAADKLYRNDGKSKGGDHPVFTDVSIEAGIKEDGYGLGVIISDFNNDNWPDIYVANDYVANDILWLNNGNGTFSNVIASAIKSQTYSSMGVDAADLFNNGLIDIISLDMLPETNEAKKMMFSFLTNDRYQMEKRMGYQPQFMRNMLQYNHGLRDVNGKWEPFFSEIGQLSGIQQTDWSWSVLLADFDNDGWKDIHISNGYGRDMLNNDFIGFKANAMVDPRLKEPERNKMLMEKLAEFGDISLENYLFKNNKDLTFSNISQKAGITSKAVSTGCAYVDLDNDGDLDLVVNNINKKAFLLKNNHIEEDKGASNYVKLILNGPSDNINGIGAKIWTYSGDNLQFFEQQPARGYASTVDKRIHIGFGKENLIDSLKIQWPDQTVQILKQISLNKILVLEHQNASLEKQPIMKEKVLIASSPFFSDASASKNIEFRHKEAFFNDYQFQKLLTQKYSQLGPFISTGDVNGDGLTDFFIGGAHKQSGKIFIQKKEGTFSNIKPDTEDKEEEDTGSVFIDVDGDGDLDLIVLSGGFGFEVGSGFYQPRLYKNNGKGNFTLDTSALPSLSTSAVVIKGADFDNDGDIDLFIGGRISPEHYPLSPRSYILENNNGKFTDVTEKVCSLLKEPGMVTAALWTDFDNDGKADLIVTGEWMPIRFFKNTGGKLEEVTAATGLKTMNGLWRSIYAADLDNDGDMDYIVGNLGSNNKYKVLPSRPLKFYVKDLDYNGLLDPILAYYIKNRSGNYELYPDIGRNYFAAQVPALRKKFIMHKQYSDKRIMDIFSNEDMRGMTVLTSQELQSGWLENKGTGKFVFHPLPVEAQFAPVNAIECADINNDGFLDIILAGNEYQTEVMTGRYDASYGLLLLGDGKGDFKPVNPQESNLILDGDVKDLKIIKSAKDESLLLIGINDENMRVLKIGEDR